MTLRHALVVDDDTDAREVLAQILESHGYTVRQAENGKVALDMIRERAPCLMLLDLQMPVMNGWEVLAWMEHDPARETMAVVVLSAAASAPPNVTFLRKPCELRRLLDTIHASELRRERVRIDRPGTSRSVEHLGL
jgi:CheY-like chemotaxis protein